MRNKNIKILLLLIVFLSYGVFIQEASAGKKIPFESPDIQPILTFPDLKPNISGNVDSTPGKNSLQINASQKINTASSSTNDPVVNIKNNNTSKSYLIIWGVIFVIVVGLILIAYTFLKPKKQPDN